jgi:hypothetical protein
MCGLVLIVLLRCTRVAERGRIKVKRCDGANRPSHVMTNFGALVCSLADVGRLLPHHSVSDRFHFIFLYYQAGRQSSGIAVLAKR